MNIKNKQGTILLGTILVVGFLLRIAVAYSARINPNEASYLYDAKFILDGQVPFKDFSSRSPVYIYSLAAFLYLFGESYFVGRMLSVLASTFSIFLVFKIGNKLYNEKYALIAAFIYSFSPFIYTTDSYAMTQPYQQSFVLFSVYLFLRASKEDSRGLFFLCGVIMGLGILVRRSSGLLAFSLPAFLFIYYLYHQSGQSRDVLRKVAKNTALLYGGIMLSVAPPLLYFISITSLEFMWFSYGGGMIVQGDSGTKDLVSIILHLYERTFYLLVPFYLISYHFFRRLLHSDSLLIKSSFTVVGLMFVFSILNYEFVIFGIFCILICPLIFASKKFVVKHNKNSHHLFTLSLILALAGTLIVSDITLPLDMFFIFFLLCLLQFVDGDHWKELYMKMKQTMPARDPVKNEKRLFRPITIIIVVATSLVLVALPGNNEFFSLFISIFFSFSIVVIMRFHRMVVFEKPEFPMVFLFLWIVSLILFYGLYIRWHWYYFSEFNGVICLFGAVFFYRIAEHTRTDAQSARIVRMVLVVFIISAANAQGFFIHSPTRSRLRVDVVREASDYLRDHSSSGDEIFTGDVSITFEAGRDPAYDMTRPVIYCESSFTKEQLHDLHYPTIAELIRYLDEEDVPYAVVGPHTREFYFKGHQNLEDYIYSNFILVTQIDDVEILERSTTNNSRISHNISESRNPSLFFDENRSLHVSWSDHRDESWEIYYSVFDEAGKRAIDENRHTPISNSFSDDSSLHVDSSNSIIIVWEEQWSQHSNIYFSKMDHEMNPVFKHVPVTSFVGLDVYARNPKIVSDSRNNLHVVWQWTDALEGNYELYYTKLSPDGTRVLENTPLTRDLGNNIEPSIDIDTNDDIHLVWQDGRDGGYQIYYSKLNSSSTSPENLTLIEAKRISSPANESFHPDISVDGDHLNIVWQDEKEEYGTVKTIQYLQMDLDGVVTGPQRTLTFKYPTEEDEERENIVEVMNPVISSNNGLSIVCWEDNRLATSCDERYPNIYYKVLNEDGTVLVNDTRASYYESISRTPDVVMGEESAHIVWSDSLPKNYEILHKEIELSF